MTERQKDAANAQKVELRMSADCLCVICGEYLPHDLFDLAHRVLKSKAMLLTYGPQIIFHPLNMLPACHGEKAGRSCNSRANLRGQYVPMHELIDRITRIVTGREPQPNMRREYEELRRQFMADSR